MSRIECCCWQKKKKERRTERIFSFLSSPPINCFYAHQSLSFLIFNKQFHSIQNIHYNKHQPSLSLLSQYGCFYQSDFSQSISFKRFGFQSFISFSNQTVRFLVSKCNPFQSIRTRSNVYLNLFITEKSSK